MSVGIQIKRKRYLKMTFTKDLKMMYKYTINLSQVRDSRVLETVFHFINMPNYRVALGKVNAEEYALCKGTAKRALEKQQIEVLFQQLNLDYAQLTYNELGKPEYLKAHVSISHSKGWFAVAFSEQPIGLDIEFPRANLAAGSSYFVNDREAEISDLLAIWTAKEAFFKLFGGKIDDLKENVEILEVTQNAIKVRYADNIFLADLHVLADGYCTVFCGKTT